MRITPLHRTVVGLLALTLVCSLAVPARAQAANQSPDATMLVFYLTIVAATIIVYLIPTFIAFHRKHPNRWLIAVINVAFGGTVIGWFGALVWAMSAAHLSPTGSNGGESGLNIFVNDLVTVRFADDPQRAGGGQRRSPQDRGTSEPHFEQPYSAAIETSAVEPLSNNIAATNPPSDRFRPVAVAPPAEPDVIGRLERLAALRMSGSLSDEEFAAIKTALIGRQS